jgi:tetrahydrodipicolinate N-succinyltransferase
MQKKVRVVPGAIARYGYIFQVCNYDAKLCNIGTYVDEGTMVDIGQQ